MSRWNMRGRSNLATGYNGPCIDHSILSPSGHISKHDKAAYMRKFAKQLDAWFAVRYPSLSDKELERKQTQARIDSCRRQAAELRGLASRGMCVRN